MIADPRAVAARWPDPRVRALATIAVTVTETPWRPLPELPREERAHAVALAAYFGHLNRIADAVGVPLDYEITHAPPAVEPAAPALEPAPAVAPRTFALDARPPTRDAVGAWQAYVLDDGAAARRPGVLDGARRKLIARHAAALIGAQLDGPAPASELDAQLVAFAELVTLAPWRLDAAAYAPLRAAGFDDAALFDACVVASTAGVVARIAVAGDPAG